MRRLYLQIYLALVASLLLFGVLAVGTWWLSGAAQDDRGQFTTMAELLAEVLPPPQRDQAETRAMLERLAEAFRADISLSAPDGAVLASVGEPLPVPVPGRETSGWLRAGGGGPGVALRLPDGRWVTARRARPYRARWLGMLLLLGAAVAIGAYPVVRRITGRLERLRSRVDALGAGDLSARVLVEGRDEVADLARRFNRAADRIERLVAAQRSTLAGASHELRSPLARIRMAFELLIGEQRPDLRAQIARDIAELDGLIEELLLASRLQTLDGLRVTEEVDLLALAAEEGSRVDASVSGEAVTVRGDERLLGRLLRNLFENGRRYGGGTAIQATVARDGAGARVVVCDAGPGVADEDRERIFEPFYRPPGTRQGGDRGVGLGLALVREIARRHGGEARCVAREGGGVCFEVIVPGSPAESEVP